MGKIYAVKAGRKTGKFYSWTECQKQVTGYPGAQYKSFHTEQEADQFLGTGPLKRQEGEGDLPKTEEGWCTAYVDGSYNNASGQYGYGVVLLYQGREEYFYGRGTDQEAAKMRNVAGEIMGAEAAVKLAMEKGARGVVICHDYAGIAHWPKGEWKTNLKYTRDYKEFMNQAAGRIAIEFVKVEAHTGVKYNEMADRLAKKGAGMN